VGVFIILFDDGAEGCGCVALIIFGSHLIIATGG